MAQAKQQPRIRRAEHNASNLYFLVARNTAQDDRLSYEALGLLTYLLSHNDNWHVRPDQLIGRGAGRDRVYKLLNELIGLGYITRLTNRDDKKRVSSVEYFVNESPTEPDQKLLPEKLETGKLDPVNPHNNKYNQPMSKKEITADASAAVDSPAIGSGSAPSAGEAPTAPATPQKGKDAPNHAPKPPAPRKRNEMFDALVSAFGYEPERLTSNLATLIGKTAAELKQAQYKPEDVKGIYAYCKKQEWGGTFTVSAISKYAPAWLAEQSPAKPVTKIVEATPEELKKELGRVS